MLVAVFPANIYMVQHPGQFHFAPWILWARLPLQDVFIAGVWFAAIQRSQRFSEVLVPVKVPVDG